MDLNCPGLTTDYNAADWQVVVLPLVAKHWLWHCAIAHKSLSWLYLAATAAVHLLQHQSLTLQAMLSVAVLLVCSMVKDTKTSDLQQTELASADMNELVSAAAVATGTQTATAVGSPGQSAVASAINNGQGVPPGSPITANSAAFSTNAPAFASSVSGRRLRQVHS